MDASRSATIYTRDDTSAQHFFYYVNICVRLHVSTIQVVVIRSLIEITGLQKAAHILGSQLEFTSWLVSEVRGRKIK
jgi:hypothetical protein